MKTKVTTSICRHHLIQTQAWRVPIYMHRHNDYDDVKDNGDGNPLSFILMIETFFVLDRAGAIYMQRHNDSDDVKDNGDGDAVVNDLDDVGPSRGNLYATGWTRTGYSQT